MSRAPDEHNPSESRCRKPGHDTDLDGWAADPEEHSSTVHLSGGGNDRPDTSPERDLTDPHAVPTVPLPGASTGDEESIVHLSVDSAGGSRRLRSAASEIGKDSDVPRNLPPLLGNRYALRRLIGRGGFGYVFEAYDQLLQRAVALKIPRVDQDEPLHPRLISRLEREARRLARLRHPSIVAVFDVGSQDGIVYYVAELLEGPNLKDWASKKTPSWQDVVHVVARVAEALHHAHEQDIVHLDVKPQNIIMTPRGPVLVDFGLAENVADLGASEHGRHAGTPAYMAPEQIDRQLRAVGTRTDIYALGVVLYELLTGQLPFRARDRRVLLSQICNEKPEPPHRLRHELPLALSTLCLQCLEKEPARRLESASELADQLRAIASSASTPPAQLPAPAQIPAEQFEHRRADKPSTEVTAAVVVMRRTACSPKPGDSVSAVGGAFISSPARILQTWLHIVEALGCGRVLCLTDAECVLTFPSASSAVAAALEFQAWAAGQPNEQFAIGIDRGVLEPMGSSTGGRPNTVEQVRGPAVTRARELARLALPRQILVTEVVYEHA